MPTESNFPFTAEQLEWIAALRSGKYKQTDNVLTLVKKFKNGKIKTKHCCLGVACEVFKERLALKNNRYGEFDDDNEYIVEYGKSELTEAAPREIMDLLKLRTELGSFLHDDVPVGRKHACSLTQLNDEVGYDFEQIADFMEKNPEEVFTNNEKQNS